MRQTPNPKVEPHRVTFGPLKSDKSYGNNGQFLIPHTGLLVVCQVSDEGGWEHVSVTLGKKKGDGFTTLRRTPNWAEMQYIKELFWEDDEVVIQYHPAKSNHISIHDYCLHMWRPVGVGLPLPPKEFV